MYRINNFNSSIPTKDLQAKWQDQFLFPYAQGKEEKPRFLLYPFQWLS